MDNLRDAITFAISPPAREAARQMAQQIHEEVWFLSLSFHVHACLNIIICRMG